MSLKIHLAGINPYVIAFTALASGTSWPDLVASKIAAERQTTADSAIANITCRFYLLNLISRVPCRKNTSIRLKFCLCCMGEFLLVLGTNLPLSVSMILVYEVESETINRFLDWY